MKLSLVVEDGVRRMRNGSQGMDWKERRGIMEEWARKLRRNGYPDTVRHQVVNGALRQSDK